MSTIPSIDVRMGDQQIQRLQRLHLRFGLSELADAFEVVSAERAKVSAGDPVTISVDGRPVLVGFVMGRRRSNKVGDRSITWSGFSSTQVLVKSSVVQPRRSWSEISLRTLAETLVSPYGFGVEVDPSVTTADEPLDIIRSELGETVFAFLTRAATRAACMVTSGAAMLDKNEAPRANILLTRVGARRSEAPITVPHPRVLEWDSEEDWRDLHSHYYVNTRGGGRLDSDGTLVGVDGSAEDERVPYSPIILQAIAGAHQTKKRSKKRGARSQADLDRQAEWEMRRRTAEASRHSVVMSGWSPAPTGTGTLWSPNTVVQFVDHEDGFNDDLLITSVELDFDVGNQATVARMELLPPDAFSVFGQPLRLKPKGSGSGSGSGSGTGGYRVDPEYMEEHGTLVVKFDDRGRPKPPPPTLLNAFVNEMAAKDDEP